MKLSEYAKKIGVSYRTGLNYYHKGRIPGAYQLESGSIIVPEQITEKILTIMGPEKIIMQIQSRIDKEWKNNSELSLIMRIDAG